MKLLTFSIVAVLAVGGWVLSSEASGADDILKAKGCLNCHDYDKKKVGPAYKDVAEKKAGKADELVAKIRDAKGHPKVNATEAEIKEAVDKVLATK